MTVAKLERLIKQFRPLLKEASTYLGVDNSQPECEGRSVMIRIDEVLEEIDTIKENQEKGLVCWMIRHNSHGLYYDNPIWTFPSWKPDKEYDWVRISERDIPI